jgi:hypothetical protein
MTMSQTDKDRALQEARGAYQDSDGALVALAAAAKEYQDIFALTRHPNFKDSVMTGEVFADLTQARRKMKEAFDEVSRTETALFKQVASLLAPASGD